MISYEALYEELLPVLKRLKDGVGSTNRLQKAIQKDTESGDLVNVKKNIGLLKESAAGLTEAIEELSGLVEQFDTQTYFAEGDFARQLVEACKDVGVDVKGERGIYEMFPYKVRIVGDEDHDGEVYINRKKLPSFRPSYVAEFIRTGQEKLFKAKFNAVAFMNEVADAYETTCLKSGARIGSTQKLDKIYKALVPTARARKEYDKQSFAFDLERIYEAGPENWITKSGERYYFGTSRDGKTGYRVIGSTGTENYISTIKRLNEEV